MVVNRGELETHSDFEVRQVVAHGVIDIAAYLRLAIICREEVAVNLVDEDLVNHVGLDLVGNLDDVAQVLACSFIVLLLGINHIDDCTALFDLGDS
jgi:hypothetical protein